MLFYHYSYRCKYLLSLVIIMATVLAACQSNLPPSPVVSTSKPAVTPTARPKPTQKPQTAVSPTPSASPEPTSQLNISAGDLDGQRVELWHAWNGIPGKRLAGLVDEFNRSNEWGIQVEAVPHPTLDELYSRVAIAVEELTLPAVSLAASHEIRAWDAAGVIIDLNPYAQDPIWGWSSGEQEDFIPAFWERDTLGDKRVAIPVQGTGQVLYYNQTWGRELGFSAPPATTNQFRQQVCAAAATRLQDEDVANDGTGGYAASTEYATTLSWIYAFGGSIVADGNNYRFETPQVESSFRFLRDLLDAGCAWLPENVPPETVFTNRGSLIASGSMLELEYISAAWQQSGSSDQWTVLPFPGPDGKSALDVSGQSGAVFAVEPAERLAAWLFVRWLAEPHNQALLSDQQVSLPVRTSALDLVKTPSIPQWQAGLDLLPLAKPEPALQSWSTVRWVLSDATTQLYRYYFSPQDIPDLVELLADTAGDLHRKSTQ